MTGKELLKVAEKNGFTLIRVVGSHYQLRHEDGRRTSIPAHGNRDLPKGTVHQILKDIGDK